ncbi:MAG: M23 family metallopeptidase, partial [Trichodesmium sp. MAG_R01]|nr:M23 family metallopeptidase [Trichodesmium sp. MAG_R01]
QIWLKNLDTEEWSWVTTKDEWKSTVGMEDDTTIKDSYTIPSDKGGRYYVGFFHYENDQEAYFGLNWKEKGTKYSYFDELADWPDGPTTELDNQNRSQDPKVKKTWNWVAADNTRITGAIPGWPEKDETNYEDNKTIKQIYTDLSTAILGDYYKCTAGYVNDISYKQDPEAGKKYGWHDGIDLDTDNYESTNVKALIGGTIKKKDDDDGHDGQVVIEGDDGRFYHYLHLFDVSNNLSVDNKIRKGETIGVVGPSFHDKKSNPSHHLHFSVTNTLNRPNGYDKNKQKDVYEWTHNPLKVFWQLKREGLI